MLICALFSISNNVITDDDLDHMKIKKYAKAIIGILRRREDGLRTTIIQDGIWNYSITYFRVRMKMKLMIEKRIFRLLENGEINNHDERHMLEYLLKAKKWNPYCIRHSAITADSDYLPEYALKKKVRWSMNSKQGSRYVFFLNSLYQ